MTPTPGSRARPLSVEERRASIIDATIPLLLEHGSAITSRQIAEAAGIAEGTIFRAFGDKESLVTAAVSAFMDRGGVPHVDHQLPLEEKLRVIVEGMRHRVSDVMRMARLTGRRPNPSEAQQAQFGAWIASVFDGDRHLLRIAPEDLGDYIRAFAIGMSVSTAGRELTTERFVDLLLHGILMGKD